ncbi:hypothetical protein NW863_03245 [Synechococcus sp. B60.1]|uniref:hypothetical protein n=1 Tax=Synechococcus sp. B60.1 TaxID=2964522 RepID=UPI0039C1EA3D
MLKRLHQPGGLIGIALLAGVLALLWPMLQRGYPITHSTHFNLNWAFQYQRQFFGGQFYPRWLEYSNFGYGNPTFAFYPPLCMVATLPFRALGLDMLGSLVASMGLAMAVFGLGLYLLLRQVLPWALALVLALLSMAGPYWLVDIYQRGAIGEVWAIAVSPWVFWASLQTICRLQALWPVAALALSYGLLALSHLPTLLVLTLIWLPLPWVVGGRDPFWPRVGRCYLGFGLGLGWTAFYLLSAFWDQRHVQVDFVNFTEEYTPHHRLMVSGLMQLKPRWTEHWFESNLVGYWVWMAAVLGGVGILVFLEWLARRSGRSFSCQESGAAESLARATLLYSLGASLVALLMMTDLLAWLYEWVLPLRRIQFSWRWMAVTAVTVPWLVGSLAGWGWGHKRWRLPLLVGLGLAMAVQTWQGLQLVSKAGFDPPLVQTFQELAAAKQFPNEPQERPGIAFLHMHWRFPDGLALVDALEYRPRQVTLPMPPPQVDPLLQWQGEVEDPAARLQVEEWRYGYRRFRALNPTGQEQAVVLRTFYYPAWRVQIDGWFRAAEYNEPGLLQVRIPPGEHRVEVRYLGTAADWLGWILTGVAGVLLVELRRLLRLLGLRTTEEATPC